MSTENEQLEDEEMVKVKSSALLANDLGLRDLIAGFVMDRFNNVPETGHFYFDIHDAADLIDAINAHDLSSYPRSRDSLDL